MSTHPGRIKQPIDTITAHRQKPEQQRTLVATGPSEGKCWLLSSSSAAQVCSAVLPTKKVKASHPRNTATFSPMLLWSQIQSVKDRGWEKIRECVCLCVRFHSLCGQCEFTFHHKKETLLPFSSASKTQTTPPPQKKTQKRMDFYLRQNVWFQLRFNHSNQRPCMSFI